MDLASFINYNSQCPICGEKLTLYAQWLNSTCFVAKQLDTKHIRFTPHLLEKKLGDGCHFMDLIDGHWNFSSLTLNELVKSNSLYLFFLCNPGGFKVKNGNHDYEISLYHGCYTRQTPLLKFKQNHLVYAEDETTALHCREDFAFKKYSNNIERIYMLSLQEQHDNTTIWHYSVTDEQKKIKGFKPSIFEKEIPSLGKRPDFSIENRDKLIERFDSWIIMS